MRFPPKVADRVAGLLVLALLPASVPRAAHLGASQTSSTSDGAERLHWKPVEQAQVKLDDKTPLSWNVYQPDKKDKKSAKKASTLVLLLLGHRYLMLDLEARLAYEVPVGSLQARGTDFESGDRPSDERLIPSSDWTLRDVGPAELIRLTLGDYGRALEVSLPHPPDMRPFY
ncbi:MAG TPA: hypothetical protein VEJ45_04550 [Candidatus Acidoferrales bacterium]|nr:hypothetical protein [Candidatus Acidoferrales bacterium]